MCINDKLKHILYVGTEGVHMKKTSRYMCINDKLKHILYVGKKGVHMKPFGEDQII
jgi:hypothetical protein